LLLLGRDPLQLPTETWELSATFLLCSPSVTVPVLHLTLFEDRRARNLYPSPNIIEVIKTMRWTVHVERVGEMKKYIKVLVRKPEWKRPLGRPGCRREDNIRMDFRER